MTSPQPEQDRIAQLEAKVAELSTRDGGVGSRLTRLLKLMPWLMASHFLIGAPALLISLGVAYATFVQAEATKKMQQADAWPFVSYGTSNVNEKGERVISLVLSNNGVGPALLGPIEISYQGKPVRDPRDLLLKCCGPDGLRGLSLSTSPSSDIVARPGESINFMQIVETPENKAVWDRFEKERWKLQVRSCYCSIFDECWTIEGAQSKPKAVAQCPADWVRFRER
ncbi:hypothetical protein OK349_18795 [Sphingomonas sp. BT-65]|uniref:hypothetical protein n=1 Tax=Sphingomonas sp. BT-65 TaxID=2989821 RepID=UPI0022369201|nr:hypothetical protein [Sphingomonas sp. BT-65]MCW4463758.1 hypothetical protein [Sphingomonas sp. BT-65]